jgi:LPXTG-motif cell wall-anchored protein
MKAKQRLKLGAGAGLVTMLLGALMVLAPTAGADDPNGLTSDPAPANLYGVYGGGLAPGNSVNLKCSTGESPENVADGLGQITDRPEDTWDNNPLEFAGLTEVEGTATPQPGTNPLQIDWSTDVPVRLVIVKQATVSAVYEYPAGAESGTVTVVLPIADANNTGAVSHVTFCAGEPAPEEPTLTVTKVIDSEDEGALAATFPISVEQDEAVVQSGNLGHDDSLPVIDPASGEYEISEDLPEDGWETPTIDCVGADATGDAGGPWTVVVGETDVVCTITNTPEGDTPPPPPTPSFTYGLDVDKVNDADEDGEFSDAETADEEGATVEFQITIRNTGSGPLVLESIDDRIFGLETVDLLEEGVLDCGDVVLTEGSVLAGGAVVTCTFELDDYAPAPGTSQTNTVDVVTDRAEDEDTSVVDVEPIEVLPTPPVTPPGPPAVTPPVVTPPQAQPAVQPAQVLGAQTVRTLPRTGDETRSLAGAGAFMVALGAALVLSTRRQYADR